MNRHITAAALPDRLVVSPTDWLFLDIVSTHPVLLFWLPTTVAFSCLFIRCDLVLVYWCCYLSDNFHVAFVFSSSKSKTMILFSPKRFVVIATAVLPLSYHLFVVIFVIVVIVVIFVMFIISIIVVIVVICCYRYCCPFPVFSSVIKFQGVHSSLLFAQHSSSKLSETCWQKVSKESKIQIIIWIYKIYKMFINIMYKMVKSQKIPHSILKLFQCFKEY